MARALSLTSLEISVTVQPEIAGPFRVGVSRLVLAGPSTAI